MQFRQRFLGLMALLLLAVPCYGQNFFDQLKQEFRQEAQNAVQQWTQTPRPGTPPGKPQPRSFNSLPSEGGKRNIGNPGYGGGDEFVIQNPQPRPNPRPNPRVQPYPIQQQPRYVNPSYPQGYVDPYVRSGTPQYVSDPYVQTTPEYTTSSTVVSSNGYTVPSPPASTANLVRIHCTGNSAGSCPYTLVSSFGEYPFSISANQEQRFSASAGWKLRMVVNGKTKTFNLTGGKLYRIKRANNGWQIYVSD